MTPTSPSYIPKKCASHTDPLQTILSAIESSSVRRALAENPSQLFDRCATATGPDGERMMNLEDMLASRLSRRWWISDAMLRRRAAAGARAAEVATEAADALGDQRPGVPHRNLDCLPRLDRPISREEFLLLNALEDAPEELFRASFCLWDEVGEGALPLAKAREMLWEIALLGINTGTGVDFDKSEKGFHGHLLDNYLNVVVARADTNSDGRLTLQELCALIRGVRRELAWLDFLCLSDDGGKSLPTATFARCMTDSIGTEASDGADLALDSPLLRLAAMDEETLVAEAGAERISWATYMAWREAFVLRGGATEDALRLLMHLHAMHDEKNWRVDCMSLRRSATVSTGLPLPASAARIAVAVFGAAAPPGTGPEAEREDGTLDASGVRRLFTASRQIRARGQRRVNAVWGRAPSEAPHLQTDAPAGLRAAIDCARRELTRGLR
jgi:hypothetical protein